MAGDFEIENNFIKQTNTNQTNLNSQKIRELLKVRYRYELINGNRIEAGRKGVKDYNGIMEDIREKDSRMEYGRQQYSV